MDDETRGPETLVESSRADGPARGDDVPAVPGLDTKRFVLGRERARGGQGRIVEARDGFLGREIAVKQLLDDAPVSGARFLREAVLTARLRHPAIIPIYDAGVQPEGGPFYSMPIVPGRSLREAIDEAPSLDQRLALLSHVQSVADAIAYAHDQGVIHRDLKPSNVLVGPFGETVVIDWGLAKDMTGNDDDAASASGGDSDSVLQFVAAGGSETRTGSVLGTPAYMAPEQARGGTVDGRADVYALGAMLYHLLSGRPPHDDLESALKSWVTPLPELVRRVPKPLAAICEKAMAFDPEDRYETAREFAAELRRFQTGQLVAAHAYRPHERLLRFIRRHRAAVAVAVISLAVVTALAVVSFRRITDERNLARAAEKVAASRGHSLTFVQGRNALERDPTESLGWLRTLPDVALESDEAQTIAALAESAGVARHIIGGFDGPTRAMASPTVADQLALGGAQGRIEIRSFATGQELHRLEVGLKMRKFTYLPDGSQLVAAATDGKLHFWQTGDWSHRSIQVSDVSLMGLAVSSDSKLIAIGDRNGVITLWSSAGEKLNEFRGHEKPAFALAFSPDGSRLASSGPDHVVRLWKTADPNDPGPIVSRHKGWSALQFTNDGKTLVTGAISDESFQLVDVESATVRKTIELTAGAWEFELSPDGERLAWCGNDGLVHILDLDGEEVDLLGAPGRRDEVPRLEWSPDGRRLAFMDMAATVWLWDLATRRAVALRGHRNYVMMAKFSIDGRWLATVSSDGTVRIWDAQRLDASFLPGNSWKLFDVAFSPDGKTVAAGSEERRIGLWEPGKREWRYLEGCTAAPKELVWSPDSAHVLALDRAGSIRRFDVSGSGPGDVLVEKATGIASSADGAAVVAHISGDAEGEPGRFVWVDNATGATRERAVPAGAAVAAFALAGDGETLLWADGDRLWRARWDGEPVELARPPGPIVAMAAAGEGSRYAVALENGAVALGDAGEPGAARVVLELAAPPQQLQLPGTGTRLLAIADDGALVVVGDDGAVFRPDMVGAKAIDLGLSDDGRWLAAACDDKTTRLWNLEEGSLSVLNARSTGNFAVDFASDGRLAVSSSDIAIFDPREVAAVPRRADALRAWFDQQTTTRLDLDQPYEPPLSPAP